MRSYPKKIKSIAKELKMERIRTVKRTIEVSRGSQVNMIIRASYAKIFSSEMRIISLQGLKKEGHKATFKSHSNVGESYSYA